MTDVRPRGLLPARNNYSVGFLDGQAYRANHDEKDLKTVNVFGVRIIPAASAINNVRQVEEDRAQLRMAYESIRNGDDTRHLKGPKRTLANAGMHVLGALWGAEFGVSAAINLTQAAIWRGIAGPEQMKKAEQKYGAAKSSVWD